MRVNADMLKGRFSVLGPGARATALGSVSLALTLVVVLTSATGSSLSALGALGMVAAILLACLAATDAARPAERDQPERRE